MHQHTLKGLRSSVTLAARAVLYSKKSGGIWHLMRAAIRVLPIVFHLPGHFRLVQIFNMPGVSDLLFRRPKLVYKYLYRPYLVHCFSRKTRLAILQNHYFFLGNRTVSEFFTKIFDGNYTLWEKAEGDKHYRIALSFPLEWDHDYEGDLLLTFNCGEEPVYSVTFTIASALSLGFEGDQLVLVTAIQGKPGKRDLIREATKEFSDLSPPVLLVSAVEGLAMSLGIDRLVGIGIDQQVQKQTWGGAQFNFDYDEFWRSMHMDLVNGIYYLKSIPEPSKPIEEIRQKHRKKTLARRGIKSEIQSACMGNFRQKCLKEADRRKASRIMFNNFSATEEVKR